MSLRTLGAVLAGGQASRFGSDKAMVPFGGRPLIACVAETLEAQCEAVVICGRILEGHRCRRDHPVPGLGPLGGLAAALQEAVESGFDQVLCAPCDTPYLPINLLTLLGEAPSFVAAMPVIGLWPAALADKLEAYLLADPRRAMRGWAAFAEAHPVMLPYPIANVNTPADLARL